MPPPWELSPPHSVELLEYFEERAAVGEYERGLSRAQAEQAAMVLMLELMRRAGWMPAWAERHYHQENLTTKRRQLRARIRSR